MELSKMLSSTFDKSVFSPVSIEDLDAEILLLQSGYLSISGKSTNAKGEEFYLDFPNYDVRDSFNRLLVAYFTHCNGTEFKNTRTYFENALQDGNIQKFMEKMEEFLAGVNNYDITVDSEGRFGLVFYMVFAMLPGNIPCESKTSNGSIDAVAITDKIIYIFEFKRDQTAEIALKQIYDQQYFLKYRGDGKQIYLIGINYDSATRLISAWIAEKLHWKNGIAEGVRYVPEMESL